MDALMGGTHGEGDSYLLPVPFEEGASVNEFDSVSDTDLEADSSACMNADNVQDTNGSLFPEASINMKPRIGMDFATEEDAYNFYNDYAQHCGFSVKRDQIRKIKSGEVSRCILRCCKAEEEHQKVLDLQNRKKRVRSIMPCFCPASITINLKREKNRYEITKFVESHNHSLCTPTKTHWLHSHRKIPEAQLNMIASFNSVDINVEGSIDSVNFGYSESDARSQESDGDAQALLSFLQKKTAIDSQFTYQIRTGKDRCLTALFWVDRQSKIDYKAFSDVVCFGTTYGTNKYNMPFGSFVGINHHMNTILLGAGLLSGEKVADFKWLFQSWLNAMGGVHPKTIITNQDAAIKRAVAEVFPHTHHILCLWHITKRFPVRLSHLCQKHPTFKAAWNYCLYGTKNIQEYERSWLKMIEEFGLQDNSWLQRMYAIRRMWIPSYTRCIFTAGMRTTGRIASVKSMFNGFVGYESGLVDFLKGYEKVVEGRRRDEEKANFALSNGKPALKTKWKVEAEMASVYTLKVFLAFQKEVEESNSYHAMQLGKDGITEKWLVYKFVEKDDDKRNCVTWNVHDLIASCSCLKFEFCGIVCKHIITLFQFKGIVSMPPKHILGRWTQMAKRAIAQHVSSCPIYAEDSLVLRCRVLTEKFSFLKREALKSLPAYTIVKAHLDKANAVVVELAKNEMVDFAAYVEAGAGGQNIEAASDNFQIANEGVNCSS